MFTDKLFLPVLHLKKKNPEIYCFLFSSRFIHLIWFYLYFSSSISGGLPNRWNCPGWWPGSWAEWKGSRTWGWETSRWASWAKKIGCCRKTAMSYCCKTNTRWPQHTPKTAASQTLWIPVAQQQGTAMVQSRRRAAGGGRGCWWRQPTADL